MAPRLVRYLVYSGGIAAILALLYYSYYFSVQVPGSPHLRNFSVGIPVQDAGKHEKEEINAKVPVIPVVPDISSKTFVVPTFVHKKLNVPVVPSIHSDPHSSNNPPRTLPAQVSENSNLTDTESSLYDERPTARLFDQDMVGHLNYDVWNWIVGYTVDDMRFKRSFPNFPDERKMIDSLKIEFSEKDPSGFRGKYAHKIYGYLLPSTTGDYFFSIEMTKMTAACTVEFWISTDHDPTGTRRLLILEYPEMDRSKDEENRRVETGEALRFVESQPLYFEFLEKAFDGQTITEIKWKFPGSDGFSTIPSHNFAMAAKFNPSGQFTDWLIAQTLQGPLPSNQLQSHHPVQYVGDTIYPITDLAVLPPCDFHPQYTRVHRVQIYRGIYEIFESAVYPPDDTWHQNVNKNDRGSKRINKAVVDKVLSLYRKAFNESKYKGEVLKVRSMEETPNKDKGLRFLLELDIKLKGQDEIVHTSEYVYLPTNSEGLCHTQNFQWTKNVDVHIVVSLKNLGVWVTHLIHNMEYIYSQTHDEHFHLIVVDYHSEDLNVEEELKKSSLKRWKVIQNNGGFSRSGGLQSGIDSVTDPNCIVMTIDMHLTIPPGLIEYIRRHVVAGKMGFAPMFFRLRPGYTEVNLNGFWETLTYGLFGMYKSDWKVFGGFNTRRYTVKWGGEDWDLVDKAAAKGYELFRIRYPGLVHYFHTRAGMWGDKKKTR